MARYIDADKVLLELQKFSLDTSNPYGVGYSDCLTAVEDVLNEAPTADVAEVKWIDVNERLPEKNVRVLVYLKENACDYTRIDTDRRIDNGQWVRWGNNVTHWMLLPKPPNGAKMDGGKEE